MTAILDQKHYIEELNRHLSCTVTDLQAKMDSLEKTNCKLIEEVRISKEINPHGFNWDIRSVLFDVMLMSLFSSQRPQTESTLCVRSRSILERKMQIFSRAVREKRR